MSNHTTEALMNAINESIVAQGASPDRTLEALCKKIADVVEAARVLQASLPDEGQRSFYTYYARLEVTALRDALGRLNV